MNTPNLCRHTGRGPGPSGQGRAHPTRSRLPLPRRAGVGGASEPGQPRNRRRSEGDVERGLATGPTAARPAPTADRTGPRRPDRRGALDRRALHPDEPRQPAEARDTGAGEPPPDGGPTAGRSDRNRVRTARMADRPHARHRGGTGRARTGSGAPGRGPDGGTDRVATTLDRISRRTGRARQPGSVRRELHLHRPERRPGRSADDPGSGGADERRPGGADRGGLASGRRAQSAAGWGRLRKAPTRRRSRRQSDGSC